MLLHIAAVPPIGCVSARDVRRKIMKISWVGASVLFAGLAAVVLLQIFGSGDESGISNAILAGLLGLFVPQPAQRK